MNFLFCFLGNEYVIQWSGMIKYGHQAHFASALRNISVVAVSVIVPTISMVRNAWPMSVQSYPWMMSPRTASAT